MKKSLIFMTCLSVVALALVACHRESGFFAGTEMNADEIRDYREKLLTENTTEPESEEKESQESSSEEKESQEGESKIDPEGDESQELPDVCYYVKSGKVWHASKNCSYLKNAKEVLEGDVEEVEASGKSNPCSRCASSWK